MIIVLKPVPKFSKAGKIVAPPRRQRSFMVDSQALQQEPKQENMLVNLLFNVVVPTLILIKLSGDEYLGTTWGIVVALSFPIAYGLRDFHRRGKINFFSGLGVFSICLTGGISLLGLDPQYLAIKEATVPALFGIATVLSLKTRYPLVRTLLFNDTVIETQKVELALAENNSKLAFEKRLITASWIIAASFFLSSILNYLLATFLVTSQPGSVEYNAQLGKMTALSFPVIALPAMLVMLIAMIYLFRGITRLTGMPFESIVKNQRQETEPPSTKPDSSEG